MRRQKDLESLWKSIRGDIIGAGVDIETPFGPRLLTYADYTASGRGLRAIESYLQRVLELYGNTHTEDDATGGITSERLHKAEAIIKRWVQASDCYKIIHVGSGTTGAIHHLQQILGIYIPPAGRELFKGICADFFHDRIELERFQEYFRGRRPVVFVGPYEHHSNEVSWRECFAEVVEIELDAEGLLDLGDLERKLADPRYQERMKIGSFSAASNVTGVRTPVYEVARLLHRHGALAFFDYAAIAPYGRIEICRDRECFFDGIFLSPHKFLGGPGTTGVLIIHERLYRRDLSPTIGAGGTVDFVDFHEQFYVRDIESREKPGTPGIMQILKAALVLDLQEKLEPRAIEQREAELIGKAFERLLPIPEIEIVGNRDPEKRIAILSFNIRYGSSYLHPRFVVRLMNDLFGIQARAGCSCAAPYGHRLLHIDQDKSSLIKENILSGRGGIRPGWVRLNFHYLISAEELDFICEAIQFLAANGKYFLPLYKFDISTGRWRHLGFRRREDPFGIDEALRFLGGKAAARPSGRRSAAGPASQYRLYLKEARRLAAESRRSFDEASIRTTAKDLIAFAYYAPENEPG